MESLTYAKNKDSQKSAEIAGKEENVAGGCVQFARRRAN